MATTNREKAVMVSDSEVIYFESVRVVISDEGGTNSREVTYARLPESMSEYDDLLAGHRDDPFIYWYLNANDWEQLLTAKQGDYLASGDYFVSLTTGGEQ